MSITATLPQFAAELGLTRDVLRRVVSEGGVQPVGGTAKRPLYKLVDIHRAIVAQGDGAEANPHSRLALAKAIRVELETAARRRELIEFHEHERALFLLANHVARSYDTAVDVTERDVGLSPLQAQRLERHFDEQREELAMQWIGDDEKEKA